MSEVMLQQTPVVRVLPAYERWLHRWPEPAALAADSPAAALRAWDRLGYPRRALRLHAAASRITVEHGGAVPREQAQLQALPGVGTYTASAVRAFAFGARCAVVDTNVRRVLGRACAGGELSGAAAAARASALLPDDPATAARWSVAVMELGALVCTARSPACDGCPLAAGCAWRSAGAPAEPARTRPRYAGSDRQARGRLLAVLRAASEPVPPAALTREWPPDRQRERALASLLADGLAVRGPDARYTLPGDR